MLRIKKSFEAFDRPRLSPFERNGLDCLDKNEAPFSPMEIYPGFMEFLNEFDLRTYPDPYELYLELAKYTHLETEELLITFGSEQALRFCYELMVNEGDEVITLNPTFAMLDVFNSMSGAKSQKINSVNMKYDFEELLGRVGKNTKLVVIPNPNNPTGSIFDLNKIELLANKCREKGALCVIDEAYHPYSSVTAQSLVRGNENIVVTRSFSKSWGMAGVRVGYIIANKNTILLLRKLKPIDEISTYSMASCLFALKNPNIVSLNVNQVEKWKKKFSEFQTEKIKYIESSANFILVKLAKEMYFDVDVWFKNNSIKIKSNFDVVDLFSCIRFSVGKDHVMDKIYLFFKSVV